jgi:proteasome lid subunit RPN8/RPN11
MKHPDPRLITPLFVKTDDSFTPPTDESVFHVLSASGLFLCRNHPFFSSCVKARTWPSELRPHQRSLELNYPKVPQAQMELIVGYFAEVAKRHGSEAAVLLLWDREGERVDFHVPTQRARVHEGWSGGVYPDNVEYDLPTDLAPNLSVIGTMHSHVDLSAYPSSTDKHDESYFTGIHLIVGRIFDEPPQFHCEFVVDGERFELRRDEVVEGYERRRTDVPLEWIDRIEIDRQRWQAQDTYSSKGYGYGYGSGSSSNTKKGRTS